MPADQDDVSKRAHDHAWNWFSMHAAQRMQTFHFFLVVTAFLVAAYASLLENHAVAALGVATLGAWIAVWFNRLEGRSRQLVKAGEKALLASEAELAKLANCQHLEILKAVENAQSGASSYRRVIAMLQWTILAAFVAGAAFAATKL
jgi:hypothetical protein